MELIKSKIGETKDQVMDGLALLAPANIKKKIKEIKQMAPLELCIGFVKLMFLIATYSCFGVFYVSKRIWGALMGLMQGPPPEKVSYKPVIQIETKYNNPHIFN